MKDAIPINSLSSPLLYWMSTYCIYLSVGYRDATLQSTDDFVYGFGVSDFLDLPET